ncbi:MAG: hypothetical protein ABL963_00360 [Longimicrobiales bacterium]
MKHVTEYMRVLAVDPSTKGFGFAVLEGGKRLVDWGVARVWAQSDKEFLARVECLVERYRPAILVLEEVKGGRRSVRTIRRLGLVAEHAIQSGLRLVQVPRSVVRAGLERYGSTRHELATAIARRFPELEPLLPPPRKPWMSEDERMNVFDAVLLALTIIPP